MAERMPPGGKPGGACSQGRSASECGPRQRGWGEAEARLERGWDGAGPREPARSDRPVPALRGQEQTLAIAEAPAHLVARVQHDVPPCVVRDSDHGRREKVTVHLRVPLGLLLPDLAKAILRLIEGPHRLDEEELRLGGREGAHPLGVLKPKRRDGPQVLHVEDVEAANLRPAAGPRVTEMEQHGSLRQGGEAEPGTVRVGPTCANRGTRAGSMKRLAKPVSVPMRYEYSAEMTTPRAAP
eukprot:scaffold5808_cov128-Isochrysis_galbana.AAC.14